MKPATTIPELGAAVAADPGFARCVATRMWNWAMSRGDVVNDGLPLTDALANQLTTQLVARELQRQRKDAEAHFHRPVLRTVLGPDEEAKEQITYARFQICLRA